MEKFYKKWFVALSLPAVVLFVLVILIPFIMGVTYSFTDWRGTYFVGGEHWWNAFVGFENYINIFKKGQFLDSFIYTIKYTALAVIIVNAAGLSLALMVKQIGKGKGIFRSTFFLPNLLGGLALGFIWQFIFQNVYSQVLFGENGIIPIEILTNMTQNPTKALFAFAIMAAWQSAGYMMIIYLTGLNNIPGDLYEAASIDGAGAWRKFRSVTVPMLMPSFTVVFFLTLSQSFKMLDQNVALTNGDFGTRMLAMQILKTTNDTNPPDYGAAQAQAVIFFILIATVSLIQVYFTKKKEVEA